MEDIKEKTSDERKNIINDLNSIAYTRPYFSTIIAKTTKYIMELEEENKKYPIKLNDETYRKVIDNAQREFIPISVIQNKIDELENWEYNDDFEPNLTIQDQIEVLQELLDLKE